MPETSKELQIKKWIKFYFFCIVNIAKYVIEQKKIWHKNSYRITIKIDISKNFLLAKNTLDNSRYQKKDCKLIYYKKTLDMHRLFVRKAAKKIKK